MQMQEQTGGGWGTRTVVEEIFPARFKEWSGSFPANILSVLLNRGATSLHFLTATTDDLVFRKFTARKTDLNNSLSLLYLWLSFLTPPPQQPLTAFQKVSLPVRNLRGMTENKGWTCLCTLHLPWADPWCRLPLHIPWFLSAIHFPFVYYPTSAHLSRLSSQHFL